MVEVLLILCLCSTTTFTQSVEFNYRMCDSLSNAGQYTAAIPFCDKVIAAAKEHEEDSDSLLIYAGFWYAFDIAQNGDLKEAISLLNDLAEYDFQLHGYNDNYIIIQQQLLAIAETAGDQAVQIISITALINSIAVVDGDTSEYLILYYYKAGEVFLLTGDYASALKNYRLALDLQLAHHPEKDAFYARILVEMSSPYTEGTCC